MKSYQMITSICAGVVLGSLLLAGPSFAESEWQKTHSGRMHVNHRLKHQEHRIESGEKHGKISSSEAAQLHAEDQSIHNQEMQDAAEHHGHLTGSERKELNHEENVESHQIHEDRHN